MAALANEMKDVLKHYPEILRDFVAICRISRKGEKGIALLASDVIDCFSTYVPTQMWVQIISSVDDHHDPASYSTSLGKRNRKHIWEPDTFQEPAVRHYDLCWFMKTIETIEAIPSSF